MTSECVVSQYENDHWPHYTQNYNDAKTCPTCYREVGYITKLLQIYHKK